MILIYSGEITPRLEYTAKLIFEDILHQKIYLTTNSSEFKKSDLPKINYSVEKFDDELYIKPHRLLFCKALIMPDFKSVYYNNSKYFFETSPDSILPFDPLAASFFIVTRYEEYLEKEHDQYGRYSGKKSILFKNELIEKPVVNIWAQLLANQLSAKYPDIKFRKSTFRFLPTIDIDNAWAYLHKGFARTAGAFVKDIIKGNGTQIKERFKVLWKVNKDPYDTYEYIQKCFENVKEKPIVFYLLSDFTKYDKNISHKKKPLKNLIKSLDAKYLSGIHPSFISGNKKKVKKLESEILRLSGIIGKGVVRSRQHYLKLTFPKTYRRLIKCGIDEDYTMGYAAMAGFRAGICTPFRFYDLKKEKETSLRIFPFQVMDVTLHDYMGLGPAEAKEKISQLMNEVKEVGGTFISLWHNETLCNNKHWEGYNEVFEYMIKLGAELESGK